MKKFVTLKRRAWLVLFMMSAAVHAETAQVIKADSLREKPFADARAVAKLAVKQNVEIVSRDGAWYQISAAGKKGWVRMLSLRKTGAAAGSSAGSLSALATGRNGSGSIVATTGIRGLNEENLTQAAFDEVAITQAESFRVNNDDALRFAKDGNLKTRSVPALPAPGKGGK